MLVAEVDVGEDFKPVSKRDVPAVQRPVDGQADLLEGTIRNIRGYDSEDCTVDGAEP